MGYSTMISKNVRKAFTLLKDLVEKVTLTQKNPTKFNFASKEAEMTTPVVSSIDAIFVSQKVRTGKDGSSSLQNSFLFKTEDIVSPDMYDTITTKDGSVWVIVQPCVVERFITTVNVVRRQDG